MTQNLKEVRWKQRFENFEKAFKELESAVAMKSHTKLERSGLIKTFEFTFELAWKTLKDFLESEGIDTSTPREVIKKAFQAQKIQNAEIWLEALENRNLLSHTYEENLAIKSEQLITQQYYLFLKKFNDDFKKLF